MTTVRLDGAELHYDDIGAGPTILLIHGNGATAELWGDTVAALAIDHRVITYDRRGFGRSVHPPITDFRRHVDDAAALLEQLKAGPATVVGWSGGGIVAIDLAVRRPDLVASLVLEEPPLHVKKHMSFRMARTMLTVQLLRRVKGPEAGAEEFLRWASRYTSGGTAFDHFPARWKEIVRRNGVATMAELDAGTGEYLTRKQLASIHCLVTCLVGSLSDPVFRAATLRITEVLRHAETVLIVGAGHALHLDRPEEFVAAVRAAAATPAADADPV